MIQLFSQHNLIRDRSGQQRSFNSDRFFGDLTTCFRQCGITDPWLPETIAMVVEEQMLQRRDANGEPICEADLDQLVASVLAASGYPDVGVEYRRLRGVDPVASLSAGLVSWDPARLKSVLSEAVPVSSERCDELCGRLASALSDLGLRRVSDELIGQLGIHLLCTLGAGDPENGDDTWLLPPDAWRQHVPREAVDLAAEGALRFFPVSRVLPRVRVQLDLVALGRLCDLPTTEMAYFVRLSAASRALSAAIAQLWRMVCERRNHARHHSPRIILTGLDRVAEVCIVPMSPKSAQIFRNDIRSILRGSVKGCIETDLLITER